MLLLASCRSSRDFYYQGVDVRQVAHAAVQLGFDIEADDPHALYIASANWLGVPYRYGGNTRQGVDCSGLSCAIYQEVYRLLLHRRSAEQYSEDCRKVKRSHLQPGDLVFFATGNDRKRVNHVGIYLKDGRFLHSSSSRGVVVSHLDQDYYRQHYVGAGRVRR